eukprot:TRINITY_DN10306_c0_g1_i1.p1 TRINITY_DN10306_c0_g1~~TRINITY_DN10306_c0_g1_i1.p1  ORF type:complete len:1194 (+),score=171.13 TRINITY_DN10306_c0_g1_i1:65-3583(+)
MGGCIEEVKKRCQELISEITDMSDGSRFAVIAFRDHPPQDKTFVTKVQPLTSSAREVRKAVDDLQASGGGDGPEAVSDGLFELTRLQWRTNAPKVAVLMGDAPPHGAGAPGDGFPDGTDEDWRAQAESCRELGIVVYTVGVFISGVATKVFQRIAEITNGAYVPVDKLTMLLPLIVGAARDSLDRARLREIVCNLVHEKRRILEGTAGETARLSRLLKILADEGTTVDRLVAKKESIGRKARPVTEDDILEALSEVCRLGASDLAAALFPSCVTTPSGREPVGLFCDGAEGVEMMPLLGVDVTSVIRGDFAQVTVKQTYLNKSTEAIEATYRFPLDPAASVCGFSARLSDGREYKGVCMENEEAEAAYDDAIASGAGAYLLKEDTDTPNSFVTTVGNLPPQEEVTLCISYVVPLLRLTDGAHFRFPAAVGQLVDDHEASCGFAIRVEATKVPKELCTCSSHKAVVTESEGSAVVLFKQRGRLATDFSVVIETASKFTPVIVYEKPKIASEKAAFPLAALARFLPSFDDSKCLSVEVILALDCSMSMRGETAVLAEAGQAFATEMPPNCTFNVVLFASRTTSLFPDALPGTKANLAKVAAFVKQTKDHPTGGSEFFKVVRSLSKDCPRRVVIVVSDGFISQPAETLKHSRLSNTAFFPIALGPNLNMPLLATLARSTGGSLAICPGGEAGCRHVSGVLRDQLARATHSLETPAISFIPEDAPLLLGGTLPAVISGQPVSIPLLVGKDFRKATLVLKGKYQGTEISATLDIRSEDFPSETTASCVAPCAARAVIRTLEDEDENKETTKERKKELKSMIIDLAKTYNLGSRYTSFLAIEQRTTQSKGPMKQISVAEPTQPAVRPSTSKAGFARRGKKRGRQIVATEESRVSAFGVPAIYLVSRAKRARKDSATKLNAEDFYCSQVRTLQWVVDGPRNSNMNCAFNAIVAFLATVPALTPRLSNTSKPLPRAIARFLREWRSSAQYTREANRCYQAAFSAFEAEGFCGGKEHNIATGLLSVLQGVRLSYHELATTFHTCTSAKTPLLPELPNTNHQYTILFNDSVGPVCLAGASPGYLIRSFVAHETLAGGYTHYVIVALHYEGTKLTGCWFYDDCMPGPHEGGFCELVGPTAWFQPRLDSLLKTVALVMLEKTTTTDVGRKATRHSGRAVLSKQH